MPLHPPTLLIAASAALAISSAAAATIGVRQRLRRGVWWWIGANVALAAALVLHSLGDHDTLFGMLAALLALQWPIVTLTGLRRFFSRGGSTMPPWADWLALGLGSMVAVGGTLTSFSFINAAQMLALAMLAVTLYASLAVARLQDLETTPVLKSLLIALVCGAFLQAAWLAFATLVLVPGLGLVDPVLGALLAPAATALLMPQLSLLMNHERNVAQLRASHRKLRHMVEVDPAHQAAEPAPLP